MWCGSQYWWLGVGDYIVCGGADCWGWLLAWAWCGSVSFRLTGVARVPRAGSVVGLLAGACLVGAFCVGGSLGVARG